jgi:cysteinyl-tRNA synthetase
MDSEKMSKSLGNIALVMDLLKDVKPSVLRAMSVSAAYRSDVDFGEASMEQARRAVERFDNFSRAAGEAAAQVSRDGQQYLDRFRAAMDDDFNTPMAISVMFDLVKHGNMLLDSDHDPEAPRNVAGLVAAFDQMTGVLGISYDPASDAGDAEDGLSADEEALLKRRDEARKLKNWAESDSLRDQLAERGIIVEDTPAGSRWHRK